MYDPLVVDTFIAAYAEVAPTAIKAGEQAKTVVNGIELKRLDERSLRQIRLNAIENAALSECARALSGVQSDGEMVDRVATCLRQLMPSTVYCFFRYDATSDAIICNASAGDPLNLLKGLTIRLGERVSGWSAANRRTSVNSDASLEIGQLGESFSPALRSTIATPVTREEKLIGVLTAFSPQPNAFSDSHRYAIEQVANLVATFTLTSKSETKNTLVSFPYRNQHS
jgi:putative methionine-R-sulfoxide reductase with GAF domain